MEFSNAATRRWSLLPGHRVSRKPLSGVRWYLEVPNPCFPGRSWSKAQCSRKKTLDFQATPDEGWGVKLGLYGLCFGSETSARLGTHAPSHPYPRPAYPSVQTPIPLLPGDVRGPPTGVGCQSRMTAPNWGLSRESGAPRQDPGPRCPSLASVGPREPGVSSRPCYFVSAQGAPLGAWGSAAGVSSSPWDPLLMLPPPRCSPLRALPSCVRFSIFIPRGGPAPGVSRMLCRQWIQLAGTLHPSCKFVMSKRFHCILNPLKKNPRCHLCLKHTTCYTCTVPQGRC